MDRHNVDADGVERADDDARKNTTDQNCTETLFFLGLWIRASVAPAKPPSTVVTRKAMGQEK
jgi:hypothetical protein